MARSPGRAGYAGSPPDGETIPSLAGDECLDLYWQVFGEIGVDFWRWQEISAIGMWDLAMHLPPWLPQSALDILKMIQTGSTLLAQGPAAGLYQIVCKPSSFNSPK
jgi:hypothetical protein